MQEIGPLIALIIFIITTGIGGYKAYDTNQQIVNPEGKEGGPTLEKKLADLQGDLETANKGLDKQRDEYRVQLAKWRNAKAKAEYNERLSDEYELSYNFRLELVTEGEAFLKQGQDLGANIAEIKKKTMADIRKTEAEDRDKTDAILKKLAEEADASRAKSADEKKVYEKRSKEILQQTNYDKSVGDEAKRQLAILTEREIEHADLNNEVDGHVVLADVIHNTIVIDRGTADGVSNGFRFEVYGRPYGNKKISKAFIEVRKATANVSECMILQGKILLPRDASSEYVAKDREEQYSPYQDSGRKGGGVLPLAGNPKEVERGMKADIPIVEGDMIQNPFYAPGKHFNFYIAGGKEITGDFQKSAIAYRWPQIKQIVESYGGTVGNKIELGVNYVIAQKNPNEDPEFIKAKTYGIPVVYEWELFKFLDQK